MTADPWTQLGGPDREAAVRRRVQALAWVALALAVVGAAVGIDGRMDFSDGEAWAGAGLIAAGIVLAAGCLHHGVRNAHERGRTVSALALVLALGGLAVIGADIVVGLRFYSRVPPADAVSRITRTDY